MNKNSKNQTALVTGASSGIGYEYARQLAAMGFNLLLVSNEKARLNQVCEEISSKYGIQATPLYMDLAQSGAALKLYNYCQEQNIEIEILINNAGIFFFSDIANTPCSRLEAMTNLHVVTPTMLCRYFGEAMRQRRHGYILNMSSLSAWTPFPGIAVYSATKAYLKQFSYAFYNEMRSYRVGVTVVTPGAVATGLYGLNDKYQKLGIRCGIILPAEKLVKTALRGMFKRKKRIFPGFINRLFAGIYPLLPDALFRAVKKKISQYEWQWQDVQA